MESASVAVGHAEDEHHVHPPEANQSSRIDRQTLGILLFIVSEVMLFGAFFASYFLLRVVANSGPWPPEGLELPRALGAGGRAPRQPPGASARPGGDVAPWSDLPLHPDQRVHPPRVLRP